MITSLSQCQIHAILFIMSFPCTLNMTYHSINFLIPMNSSIDILIMTHFVSSLNMYKSKIILDPIITILQNIHSLISFFQQICIIVPSGTLDWKYLHTNNMHQSIDNRSWAYSKTFLTVNIVKFVQR